MPQSHKCDCLPKFAKMQDCREYKMVSSRHKRKMSIEEAEFVVFMAISDRVPQGWMWWFSELYYKAICTIDRYWYYNVR